MAFSRWCTETYGINYFSEAKIVNRVFIPQTIDICYMDPLLKNSKAYLTQQNERKGLSITYKNYQGLKKQLRLQFNAEEASDKTQFRTQAEIEKREVLDKILFKKFKANYFNKLGFDFYTKSLHRVHPGILIHIGNEEAKEKFLKEFASFKPHSSYDPLNKKTAIQMPARFLNHFYACYFKATKPSHNLNYLKQHKSRLEKILQQVKGIRGIKLDTPHNVFLDYSNSSPSSSISNTEACSTYALSLKLYAELHKDRLSSDDYHDLYMSANLIAAYDSSAVLKQSLKTDCFFTFYLTYSLCPDYLKPGTEGYPLIAKLPKEKGELIMKEINENTDSLLYGNSKTRYSKNAHFSAQRFLPDANNKSETDELILQAGGMLGHSAIVRIIKQPMSESGTLDFDNPHHYLYFKVENNLGAGCNQFNHTDKTCMGTFLTKINPCVKLDEEWVEAIYDPLTELEAYNSAMEDTLKELIKVERELLFYRPPSGKDKSRYSKLNSEEGEEWLRLNKLKKFLRGEFYDKKIAYTACDPLNPKVSYNCFVVNQMHYMQEGGSCPIFSPKSLVASVIGNELTTLHAHFMQQNEASDCIEALTKAIDRVSKKIESRQNRQDNRSSPGFFKQPERIQAPPKIASSTPSFTG